MAQVVSGRDVMDPTRPLYRLRSRVVVCLVDMSAGLGTRWAVTPAVATRFTLLSIKIVGFVDPGGASQHTGFTIHYGRGDIGTAAEMLANWEHIIRPVAGVGLWMWEAYGPSWSFDWDMAFPFEGVGWRFGLAVTDNNTNIGVMNCSFQVAEG